MSWLVSCSDLDSHLFFLLPAPKCCRRHKLQKSRGEWVWEMIRFGGCRLKDVTQSHESHKWVPWNEIALVKSSLSVRLPAPVPAPLWGLRTWFLCCTRRVAIKEILSLLESEGLAVLSWWVCPVIYIFPGLSPPQVQYPAPNISRQCVCGKDKMLLLVMKKELLKKQRQPWYGDKITLSFMIRFIYLFVCFKV